MKRKLAAFLLLLFIPVCCHVPGPSPSGRQKGNVPPEVTREPLPVV